MPRLYRVENNNLLQEKNLNNTYNDYYQKNEYRGEKKTPPPPHKKKKLNFKTCKKNTIKSLNEVETFLRNFGQFTKYIKLYKILK